MNRVSIASGHGRVMVQLEHLPKGTYLYALVQDGQTLVSRKMIVQ